MARTCKTDRQTSHPGQGSGGNTVGFCCDRVHGTAGLCSAEARARAEGLVPVVKAEAKH